MPGSPLDEMIQLLQSDRIQSPVHKIFGLQRVTYAMTHEILSLLADLPSQHVSSSQTQPSDLLSGDNSVVGANDESDHVDILDEVNEVSSDDMEEDPDFIPRTDLPEVVYVRHSEDEKAAATVIQRAYRKVLEQRRSRNKPGPEGQNRLYFHLCWKRIREENRKSDEYTRAFLGILPHLLSSLDCAELLAMAKKRKMKKLLVSGNTPEELGEISTVWNRIPYGLVLVS